MRAQLPEFKLDEEKITQKLDRLAESGKRLKEQAVAQNVDYDQLSRDAKAVLSAKFVKAMG
ncbi:hypothetical protein [Lactobacillus xujianguonis]|uniref:hypothetical protein n=1 Tax=Lactobacillus xujianguonis TaxID=2495899 RepID=UPI000FD6CE0C|nr:hypothetical protein [Lactobacillus xujianguonis]RVU73333.1 hypothetical protein EJK20_08755 [Lactobacillus xujianguonis]